MSEAGQWRRCSACKSPIALGATYWTCNVSTCNRKRTGLVFCTVSCWEVHLPTVNHRESWAVDRTAPTEPEPQTPAQGAKPSAPRRRIVAPSTPPKAASDRTPREILIIASRLKEYIRARSGFNTSDKALEPLSEIVRRVCDQAIDNASRDERSTVLDRDIPQS